MHTDFSSRTNNFLEKVNKNYFQPRGLFCLLMTWNPEANDTSQSINMATNVVAAIDSRNKFKSSSAKTYGEALFSQVAPLYSQAWNIYKTRRMKMLFNSKTN